MSYVLLIAAVLFSPLSVSAIAPQQAGVNARGIVESAEISGIDDNEMSQEIRDAVRNLAGKPFDQQSADELVMRIQAEKPEFTATTRLLPGSESDRVKVVFFLEKTNNDDDGGNINSRYVVERVEVQGFDESKLPQPIRDDMQKLVGEKLDQNKADEIQNRMEDELRPRHYVSRRVAKGSDRQHIVVIFEIHNVRWIPFVAQPEQHVVYHSKQNFSAAVNGNIVDNASTRLYFGLVDDQDELLERFAGFNFGFEATKVGTDRLGLALRYARYHDRWQPATVLADPNSIYRERSTFDPSITFAFDPRVRLTAGVSVSDLQIQYPAIHNVNANAATASLNIRNAWGKKDTDRHSLELGYEFRAGNHTLDSDFIYTRHMAHAQYVFTHSRQKLFLSFLGGTIAGTAPLFERFSLGDTLTLRGWNKFDVAPLGGNRVLHASVQYGVGGPSSFKWVFGRDGTGLRRTGEGVGVHVFYDVGAVGDQGLPIKTRHSAGFGFGSPSAAGFFLELGFPIRSNNVVPIFTMGFRF